MLQDTLLFRGTVWENIAYGKPDADDRRHGPRRRAGQRARVHHQDAAELRDDGGRARRTLSGGQRQRIAIARAIVRNTPILILDEPTSGLDAASEKLVTEALDHLMKGRTSIVIAHHLNTIRNADVIFVVKDAEVVEYGTHDVLLAKGGVYADLWAIQAAGGALASS